MNRTVLTLVFLMSATAFAIDGSIPAFPQTAAFFGVEIGRVQLSIGIYLLGFALGQIPMGMLTDHYGRRSVVLICMTLFTLSGIASSLAPNVDVLVTARFFQGFFGASGAVISRAIVRDTTNGAETGRLMSLLTSANGAVMICAPVVGAILLTMFSWRGSFLASAIFGGIGVILMFMYIPETMEKRRDGSLMNRLVNGSKAFAASRQSLLGAALCGLNFCALISVVTLSSEVFVHSFGFDEFFYAVFFAVASVGFVFGGLVSRIHLKTRAEIDLILFSAIGFAITGFGLFLNMATGANSVTIFILCIIVLFACVSSMMALGTSITLEPLSKTAGMAAALLGTIQLMFGAVCSSLLTIIAIDALALLQGALVLVSVLIIALIFYTRKSVVVV